MLVHATQQVLPSLLLVGVAAIVGPVYGVVRVIKFSWRVGIVAKALGIVSILYAGAVALVGSSSDDFSIGRRHVLSMEHAPASRFQNRLHHGNRGRVI